MIFRRRRSPLPQLAPGPHTEWATYAWPPDPHVKTARWWRRCPARALLYETEVRCIKERHGLDSSHLIHP